MGAPLSAAGGAGGGLEDCARAEVGGAGETVDTGTFAAAATVGVDLLVGGSTVDADISVACTDG